MIASGPPRSSTAATGTDPSRASGTPTTAAPRTFGWRSSAARTSSGRTLNPPRMIVSSARPRIHRKPSSSMRARSVVRIHAVVAELGRLDLEQALGSGRERRPAPESSSGSTTRSSQPGVRPPDAAPLLGPVALVVGEVPSGDAAAELGRRVRDEHRDPVPGGERVGVVRRQRRRARHHRAHAGEQRGVDVGLEDHPQRGGHEADRLGLMAPHRVEPAVDGEAFEQRERPAVVDALEDPEQSAEVDERRVHDRDARAQAQPVVLVGLVVLRADEDPFEGRVGQVDPLGWPGRAAREHPHRDPGPAGPVAVVVVTGRDDALAEVDRAKRRRSRRLRSLGDVGLEVVGLADDEPEVQGLDVGARPGDAALGVDRDDAPTGAQDPEQEPDRGRAVPQDHPDLEAGFAARARPPPRSSNRAGPTSASATRTRPPASTGRARRCPRSARRAAGCVRATSRAEDVRHLRRSQTPGVVRIEMSDGSGERLRGRRRGRGECADARTSRHRRRPSRPRVRARAPDPRPVVAHPLPGRPLRPRLAQRLVDRRRARRPGAARRRGARRGRRDRVRSRTPRRRPPVRDHDVLRRRGRAAAPTSRSPREECNFDGGDARRLAWDVAPDADALERFRVGIVGAGFGGLCAAIRLQELGIPFTIYEKNDAVGGTWYENSFPDLRVDVPNHFYSYSFVPNPDWTSLLRRARRAAPTTSTRSSRSTGSPRTSASEPSCSAPSTTRRSGVWRLRLRTTARDGSVPDEETVEETEVRALISAVGMLNRPVRPRPRGARPVRRPVVPLDLLGPRPRPPREAGRRRRNRRELDADRPGDRAGGRPPDDLPAGAALGAAEPAVPPQGRRRGGMAVPPRPVLRQRGTGSS